MNNATFIWIKFWSGDTLFNKKSSLELNSTRLPTQNNMTEASKTGRANWFEGYNAENDGDVLASLPIGKVSEEWEWLNHD